MDVDLPLRISISPTPALKAILLWDSSRIESSDSCFPTTVPTIREGPYYSMRHVTYRIECVTLAPYRASKRIQPNSRVKRRMIVFRHVPYYSKGRIEPSIKGYRNNYSFPPTHV